MNYLVKYVDTSERTIAPRFTPIISTIIEKQVTLTEDDGSVRGCGLVGYGDDVENGICERNTQCLFDRDLINQTIIDKFTEDGSYIHYVECPDCFPFRQIIIVSLEPVT
jgi:hypothetical protein